MEESANPARLIRFGVFEADLASGELRKNGRKVRIQDQPFRVLVILLERPGEVVTREQLRERLWPADTYVDFDRSLNTTVAKLRSALGDSGDNPRFIETLPRHGYRFLADVQQASAEKERAPVAGPRWRTRHILAAAAGVGLAGFAVATIIWQLANKPPQVLEPVPLTSYPGLELNPTFSPDGNDIAFAWNGPDQGNFDIYRKVIDTETEESLRLTHDPAPDVCPSLVPGW